MTTLRVQLTEEDYVKGALAGTQIWRVWRIIAIGIVAIIAAWLAGYERQAFTGVFVLLFAIAGGLIAGRVSATRTARRVFKQQKTLNRPYENHVGCRGNHDQERGRPHDAQMVGGSPNERG